MQNDLFSFSLFPPLFSSQSFLAKILANLVYNSCLHIFTSQPLFKPLWLGFPHHCTATQQGHQWPLCCWIFGHFLILYLINHLFLLQTCYFLSFNDNSLDLFSFHSSSDSVSNSHGSFPSSTCPLNASSIRNNSRLLLLLNSHAPLEWTHLLLQF